MRIGITTYALAWSIGVPNYPVPRKGHLTEIDVLKHAHNWGVDVVQYADNLPLHRLTEQRRTALRDLARQSKIDIEAGTRGTDPEHLMEYLGIAKFFNSNIVRTIVDSSDMEPARLNIEQVKKYFEEAGVYLVIENHGKQSVDKLTTFYKDLHSHFVGCCLDTVNSFGALECPSIVIQELLPYVRNLHVKDFSIRRMNHQMGFVIEGTPAGEGMLDIVSLVRKINAPDCSILLELWPPEQKTIDDTIDLEMRWAKQSIKYLKQIIS